MEDRKDLYCEVAIGNVANRGKIIKTEELGDILKKNQGVELYRSYYSFDSEILEHFERYKSVRTYKGKTYLEKIIFDIDKGETNTDTFTLQRAREFYNKLKDDFSIGENHIRIYFSGRGYHIVIPDVFHFVPSNTMHLHVRNTLEKYFPEADSIYDNTRILRVVNSKNFKSGLYKIPLTPEEFLECSSDVIKTLAIAPRTINGYYKQYEPTELPDHSNLVEYSEITVEVKSEDSIVESNYVTCIQKMYNEEVKEGNRHHKMLRIADAWKKTGLPIEATFNALKLKFDSLEEAEIKHVVEDVYRSTKINYGCNDRMRLKYCDPKCIFYKQRNNNVETVSSHSAEEYYMKNVNADYTHNSFDLKELYNIPNSYRFLPGELTILIGDTKLGKSTIIQNIATRLTDMKVLYLSLEMSLKLTFRRFIQIAHNMTKEQVDNHYKLSQKGLGAAISHIKIISQAPSIEDLRKIIADNQPNIVVVDTLDCMHVNGYNDENSKIGIIANGLRMIAQSMNIIIIAIHHVSKSASTDEKGHNKVLNVHSGKGSSAVEQKADKILSFEGNREADIRVFKTLADRDQSPMRMLIRFNKQTMVMERIKDE